MRTRLSSSQQELRQEMAAVLADARSPDQLAAECAARGWLTMTVSVQAGGLGLGEAEAVLLAERLGGAQHPADLIDQLAAAESSVHPERASDWGWRAALRRSAYLAGLADRAISLAITRARDRAQFGVPLSRFQAVMFPLAEHAVRLRGVRLRIYQLAAEADAGSGQSLPVRLLGRLAEDVASQAIMQAVHVHGASGLTDTSDISTCYELMLAAPTVPSIGTSGDSSPAPPAATDYLRVALDRRVPADWLGTAVDYPGPDCAHQMVTAAARSFPSAPAVQTAGQAAVTYQELDERTNRLAYALRRRGVTTDSVVAVCLPRSVDMVVAVLGVLKAGGAYLPVDPEYPAERQHFMITDSRATVVITRSSLAERLPDSGAGVLEMDSSAQELDSAPGGEPEEIAHAHSLAYVMYTSGSTGTPKGVEIEHRGLVNRLQWDRASFPLDTEDAILQHTSLSFDIAAVEIFGALINGARLVLAPEGAERDTAALARIISAEGITTLLAVPSLLDVLLEERPGLQEAKGLRYVFLGGEALSQELCSRIFRDLPHVELHNFYGPSEATIDVTSWPCTPQNIGDGVPIGRPLANVRTYLVDDSGMPAPVGAAGELLVGGIGLARGYRFRPDLTRERFLPDPFSSVPGARVYRTGDLARYRQDGAIEFLGRVDEQIKVRGFRVEPAEVESALEQLPAVRQAVVKAVDGARIDAYVIGTGDDGGPAADDLLAQLRTRLPAYLVPGSVQILTAFPRMPNGKIDRSALAPPPIEAGSDDEGGLPGQLTQVMAEVLHVPGVSADDDFFALGGTSLQAARMVARLRERFTADIDLGQFIEDPTCAGLANHMKAD